MSGDHNKYQKGSVSQQPEQEWKYNPMTGEPLVDGWPLYSGLPQREWQGLTDDEYEAMAEQYVTNYYFDTLKYAKAIEAKLKEKNT